MILTTKTLSVKITVKEKEDSKDIHFSTLPLHVYEKHRAGEFHILNQAKSLGKWLNQEFEGFPFVKYEVLY